MARDHGMVAAGETDDTTTGQCAPIVATVESLAELTRLRDDWLGLYAGQEIVTPWCHPDRYCAELEVSPAGVSPLVVRLGEAGSAKAMIVGRTCRMRLPCELGYGQLTTPPVRLLYVVHGGLLSDGSDVARRGIVRHLQGMLERRQVDVIAINHLPQQQALYGDLLAAGGVPQSPERHWLLELRPGGYDDLLQRFSKKHRYNMRRADRLLVEHFGGEVQLRRFDRAEQMEAFTRRAAEIAERTYQGGLGVGFRRSAVWMAILQAEAAGGRTLCYFLECRGEPIAFQVGAVYEGIYFVDFMSYLPEHAALSPGSVLLARILQDLCESGVAGVDYGFGHAEYKQAYGSVCWDEATLSLYGRGWRARTASLMQSSTRVVSQAAARGLERLGLRRWLKRAWRARLQRSRSEGGTGTADEVTR